MYVGRFAPSPTGPLHFGSLVAALASWLDARAVGGRWLVRIEDLDTPRVQPGAADEILRCLDRLGLHWDEAPVYQSRRGALYEQALEKLKSRLYWCGCSRREISDSSLGLASDGAHIYPGTCRAGLPAGKAPRARRVQVGAERIAFVDRVQGRREQDLAVQVGDFIVARADGAVAYQLAVVVDDAAQGITDVVRGADLLDSTARQIHLQKVLGLPAPRYLHVPAALDSKGGKLSKQTGAPPVDKANGPAMLARALAFLGQRPAGNLEEALAGWDPDRIPRVRALPAGCERGSSR